MILSEASLEYVISRIRKWSKELSRSQRKQLKTLVEGTRLLLKESSRQGYLGIVTDPPTVSSAKDHQAIWLEYDLSPAVDSGLRDLLQRVEWIRRSLLRDKEGFSERELQAVADRLDEIPGQVESIQTMLSAWVDASSRTEPKGTEATRVMLTARFGRVGSLMVTPAAYASEDLRALAPEATHYGVYPPRYKLPPGYNPDKEMPLANGWTLSVWI